MFKIDIQLDLLNMYVSSFQALVLSLAQITPDSVISRALFLLAMNLRQKQAVAKAHPFDFRHIFKHTHTHTHTHRHNASFHGPMSLLSMAKQLLEHSVSFTTYQYPGIMQAVGLGWLGLSVNNHALAHPLNLTVSCKTFDMTAVCLCVSYILFAREPTIDYCCLHF
jgi:hypothetical protein